MGIERHEPFFARLCRSMAVHEPPPEGAATLTDTNQLHHPAEGAVLHPCGSWALRGSMLAL